MSVDYIALVLLAAAGWFWFDSLKAREAAVRAAREICDAEGVMLLDDTVAIAAVKLARNEDGHARVQRTYEFEYSDTGDNRLKGSVVMLGQRLALFNLAARGRPPLTIVR